MREQTEEISEYSNLFNGVALPHVLYECALHIEKKNRCDDGKNSKWQIATCLISVCHLLLSGGHLSTLSRVLVLNRETSRDSL